MSKQPSSLTEQVTVILSPDPQAREIGADLLREAAADMGLKFYRTAGQGKPWSPDEDEKIRKYYPVKGSRMLYMLPGKNKTDLFARAIRLGVKFKRGD